MRGRKPRPAAHQIAEGDPRKRGRHKLQEALNAEPPAAAGFPPCPRHLRGRARAAWNFWAAELAKMNLDRRPDAPMLEGACVNYARAVQADLEVSRVGITVSESTIDETGEVVLLRVKANPAVAVSNQAWRLVQRFCAEFGLSPVSRTRLAVDKQEKLPDLAEILSKARAPRPTIQ
jgi:P27 family predicted phage terminase small subunit